MRTEIIVLVAAAAGLITGTSAFAHHGFAAYGSETITVQATVTEFRFINPHVQLYFDVTNKAGEVEQWQGELTAPNKLARAGWTKNTFKPGDNIEIGGQQLRNGGHSIRIRQITNATGEPLPIFETVDF